MTSAEVVFCLLGTVALGAGVLVVTTRHLVHAALWLVLTLAALAGCYLVLSAEFLAWVQVLIYVGAVVVLLLFGLMLTRAPIGPSQDLSSGLGQRIAAGVVAIATAGVLTTVVLDAFHDSWIDLDQAGVGTGAVIGAAVFRNWVLPFEVLSVLLLAALIGAIVLSGGGSDGDPSSDARPGADDRSS